MQLLIGIRRYWALLLLGAIGLGIAYVAHLGSLMHERAKYTIGYLTGYVYRPKSGKYYHFRFETNGVPFVGTSLSDKGMDDRNGARFVVEYDSTNPEQNIGYFALRIPDSIRQPPPNGWRKPPFPIPQWIIDRGKEAGHLAN